MLSPIIAADPTLLRLYRKGTTLPEPRVVRVLEHGRAAWRRPLCKLGLHAWLNVLQDGMREIDLVVFDVPAEYLGFNLDVCTRRCRVRRLWRWTR